MAPPLSRLSKRDCSATKGVRKEPHTSTESPQRHVSKTAMFGDGTKLSRGAIELWKSAYGGVPSLRLLQ